MKSILVSNMKTINLDEPIKYLGDIHGSDSNLIRMQSAFR
jgi:hypothetical protein